jgi:hypothetical protein
MQPGAAARAARAARSLAARGVLATQSRALGSAVADAELRASVAQQAESPPRLADTSLLRRAAFVAGAWQPLRNDGPAVRVENPGATPRLSHARRQDHR